jgi:NADPH-dependent 2,4-dienoyl-CoA reductase/sulfur reductase-like enzyme
VPVQHLVIVGGSLAGLRAAEAARKTGFTGSVTLIGAEMHLPYDRPPLSKKFLSAWADPGERTTFRTEQVLTGELGVELRIGATATGLDTDRREVRLGDVGDVTVSYDALIIATGSAARTLPGASQLTGVHVLRTVDDALALREALDAKPRHVVVVGAGFIGSEVASGARERGLDVTILEFLPAPLERALGPELGPACALLHERNGTELRSGIGVQEAQGDGAVEQLVLSDGSVIKADLVVVGVGASPNTWWLEGSGLTIDNGVVCDETLAASAPGVYAAGDIARWMNPLFGRPMRIEHWTSAAEQGAFAARNALDPQNAKPYSTVPYFWSDWYDTRIQFVGISAADETKIVTGDPETGPFIALYREGGRVVGALALNHQSSIMKYRSLIAKRASWDEALAFAAARHAAPSGGR